MDFLRRLYRELRLSDSELAGRLRALDALAAGKLPPPLRGAPVQGESVASVTNPRPRRGRPPLNPANP